MISEELRKEIRKLVEQAEEQGKITEYSDFSKTRLTEETALSEEEVAYYTTKHREEAENLGET